jgi:hypothetical protein
MKNVLVLASDVNYLEHTKSLFINAKNEGKWEGDYCLISNNIDDSMLVDFKEMGVYILHVNENQPFYAIYHVFNKYFKKWDSVMYMDCDFLIFSDIKSLINKENNLFVDIEPFKLHQYLCQGWDDNSKKEALSGLYNKYDLDQFGFNSGFMSFGTSIITEDTLNDLFELTEDLSGVNNHNSSTNLGLGTNQPIINFYFIDNYKIVDDNRFCFWRAIDNNTITAHFVHLDSQWKNDTFSDRLNTTYKSKYLSNLNLWYDSLNKNNKL